ncbi:MAG: agmatine deiminase family protein [Planctomycetales bacterium]|nr:agmatine deiminase family protein [Planctomycetales bacterium]
MFTLPAEWESQESVWLGWPTYENIQGRPSEAVHLEIIRAITGRVRVDIAIHDADQAEQVRNLLRARHVSLDHVRFHTIPHEDIWFRDTGPLFVQSAMGDLRIIDFGFNRWGYEPASTEGCRNEEQVDRLIAKRIGIPTIKSDMILEGGALESNGAGTVITTEAVVLQRNPQMIRAEAEAELKRLLGARQIVWVPCGVAEDDLAFKGVLPGGLFTAIAVGGHVDEFVRFVDSRTILLAEISPQERDNDPIAAISFDRLQLIEQSLKSATDAEGRPFTIVRAPTPSTLVETMRPGDGVYDYLAALKYEDGAVIKDGKPIKVVLSTSYLNFLVTNEIVLCPTYWKPGRSDTIREKDRRIRDLVKRFFPTRTVVPIDPENVNIGGGGIHCITQNQPRRRPR